jgi:release factor glutamine methyltransferase
MTNSKELFHDLVGRITLKEEPDEIYSMIYLLLEKVLGLTRGQIMSKKIIKEVDSAFLNDAVNRINRHEPIQYILGEADFYGRVFQVNPSVLIPRPETELLVNEIISFIKGIKRHQLKILDIGTGSGCIAITLAKEMSGATVIATDVNNDALVCARQNAKSLGANVKFRLSDVLNEELPLAPYDLIVSNPPYVAFAEREEIKPNVLHYEPHVALFAPEGNSLAFYKAIAPKSKRALNPGGSAWVEINERYGGEVKEIFEQQGFSDVQIIRDLDGKNRIVTARL